MTRKTTCLLSAIALALSAGAGATETCLRNGTEAVEVAEKGGRLFCTRRSDGYEMCNGMTRNADGTWGSKRMKHPDMPGFMRFNGLVTFSGTGRTIRGCALGMGDSEDRAKG